MVTKQLRQTPVIDAQHKRFMMDIFVRVLDFYFVTIRNNVSGDCN